MNLFERAPDERHSTRKQIPKGDAEGVDVRTRIDPHFSRVRKLLWTCKSRSADETGLRLFGTASCFRVEDLSDAVVDDFNNQRAARIRFEHDVGRLDVAMHHTARFCRSQCARSLFC